MPPRSRYARPAANRIFTNREAPIASFNAARGNLPPERHRLLTFYGIGGQGKTALCRRLRQILADEAPPQHLWGHLDLDEAQFREPARGLLQLRRSLRASGRIKTTVFDVALLTYWGRAYPTEDLNRAFHDILSDHEGLLGNIADSAPTWLGQAEVLPVGLGLGFRALNLARRKLRERGARQSCEALNDLEDLDNTELLDRLPSFLGLDLRTHRAYPAALPPILFIDTYEALWSDRPDKTGAAALETDAWVRELVASAPGVLFVIFGRERLGWDRRFPEDWADVLGDQHLLGGLSDMDAERFLEAIPIPDGPVRRAMIVGAKGEMAACLPDGQTGDSPGSVEVPGGQGATGELARSWTYGAHPFYLDLAVDTYLDLVAAGRIPAPEDFGATLPEVLARFLRYRSPEERETLKVLSVPRAFDRELFAALVERFGTRYPLTAFPDLMSFSFVESGADGHYRLHGLMRQHLETELDAATRAEIDAFLFGWFDTRCRPDSPRMVTAEHEAALREAVHHRATDAIEAMLGWFWERTNVFYRAARYRALEPLFRSILRLAEDRLGADQPQTAVAMSNLAQLLQDTNRLTEAEPLMRRALAINEASYGPEHPDVAVALNNLALLLLATDRLAEVETMMRRALAIDEASYGPEHPNVAANLHSLAQLLLATNRLAEADPLMRRSLSILEASYGPEHPQVGVALASLAATTGLAEADPLMRRSLSILEASYGPEHPLIAVALNKLALLLLATDRLAEAEPLMRRALPINEASYGPTHPIVATALNNLAAWLIATNRLAEAEPMMRRALAIDEAHYGPAHPDVARDLSNLAQLLRSTNRLDDAEALLRRALAINEASYGPTHPKVATALNNLALRLQATNHLGEAERLSRRGVVILLAATGNIGYTHPNLPRAFAHYRKILDASSPDPDESARRLHELGAEAGYPPEDWQRLLATLLVDV